MAAVDVRELATHNSRDSCWLAINGIVWDVTAFVSEHPGGANLILKVAGKDATEQYETFHSPELVEETLGLDARKGIIDSASIPPVDKQSELKRQERTSPLLSSMVSVNDFEGVAEKTMTPAAWAYVSSGADDEISTRENGRIYQKVFLRGRVLRKVGSVDCSTEILGCKSALPIYTSPVGLAKLVHPSGECAIAAADGKEGIIQVVNTVSSMPIEAIMDARVSKDQTIFWQLYADKDLQKSETFIEEDLETTVDTPQGVGIAKANTGFINADIEWATIEWLRGVTKLPLVIKGVQSVEDAVMAFDHGIDGIVLSNHGGRSQDTAQPPLLTLLEINHYAPHILDKHMQVFVDGGIRRGTDIIKALALGATAVGIGRPVLYSMSGGYGEYGVRRMIQILRNELQTNMAFIGAKNVREIARGMVNTRRLEKLMIGSVRL
ncbi:hypothetical protein LTR36_008079 [Oleoguttula mirabilis]|uniref:Uncharacterized protein n=1 Tax=Oleoguttula mirabilis TaxID=1507867 RepID=A0AAV9J8J3_9PEZI|nr:hypothetical protein LTR36_008079 [Oleoguttula mirabilis]